MTLIGTIAAKDTEIGVMHENKVIEHVKRSEPLL
jgi:hypothetical protein